jgi:hypothetical protein
MAPNGKQPDSEPKKPVFRTNEILLEKCVAFRRSLQTLAAILMYTV